MLKTLLDVEQVGELRFKNVSHRENFRQAIFGGQVLSQALMAAMHTIDERPPHSLHAYFLRAGSSDSPIYYQVEKIRDGRSISTRRVVASQHDKPIFHLSASFHYPESGYHHSDSMPDNVPPPEELHAVSIGPSKIPEHADNETSPFIILPVKENQFMSSERHKPEACFWVKTASSVPDEAAYHAATLAFASDLGLLATAVLPHPTTMFSENMFAASIDHAMWLHTSDFKTSDWLLYSIQSPWAGGARGLAHAKIFDRNGVLVASTTQEGLIRPLA